MTHADKVREAERAELLAGEEYVNQHDDEGDAAAEDLALVSLRNAIRRRMVVEAATCPTCDGEGEKFGGWDGFGDNVNVPCPAGCLNGRKVGA